MKKPLSLDEISAEHYRVYMPPEDEPATQAKMTTAQLREAAWLLVNHGQTEVAVELLRLAADREG
jgi:hypothetical protein